MEDDATERSEVATFAFHGHKIRTMELDGRTMFIAADVCAVLDHSNTSDALSRLDDEERGVATGYTLGGRQEMNVVSESGLYNLVFTSRKPEAKVFRRWVTDEVLPAIRTTGRYEAAGTAPQPAPEAPRPLPWDLPASGRFVVTRRPGHPDDIHQTEMEEVVGAVAAMDAKILAYAVKAVEARWHRARHFTSGAIGAPGAPVCPCLERAILEAGHIAQEYIDMHTKNGPADGI